jgi:hypothetical protein
MRKLFYVGFCLVLALGVGCAITDYPVIQDSYSGEIINSNGKARIAVTGQIATIWPDGTDNLFSMVDQKANGDQTLTTYNYYVTGYPEESPFFDLLYCTPDWTGCAIWTAPNPVMGDVDPFDGQWNQNCLGSRSLYSLLSTTRYYGECGRAAWSVQDRMSIFDAGTLINDFTLAYNLSAGNTSIFFDNNSGVKSLIPFLGNVGVELDIRGKRQISVNIDNPLFGNTLKAAADWADRYGTGMTTVSVSFNGVEHNWDVRLRPDSIRGGANRL